MATTSKYSRAAAVIVRAVVTSKYSIVGLRQSSYTPVTLLSCKRSALRSREMRRPRSPRTRD